MMRSAIRVFITVVIVAATPAMAQADKVPDPAARQALDAYGRCIAERKPQESLRVLTQDFRSSGYRTGLRMLSLDAQRNCAKVAVGQRGVMRSSGLLFAGAVAENLLEQSEQSVNVRLARAATVSAETFAPTDALAQCLARSLPDQVAELFSAVPGSDAEASAATPLYAAVVPCSQVAGLKQQIEMSLPAMRAMLATAALRLITKSENADA